MFKGKLQITIYNQYFVVDYTKLNIDLFREIYTRLNLYLTIVDENSSYLYYGIDNINKTYRYLITILPKYIRLLGSLGLTKKDIIISKANTNNIYKDISLILNKEFILRDYQEKCLDIIVNSDKNILLIDLPTGYGKSLIKTAAISKIGKRTAFILLSRYIDKWVKDLKQYTNIKPNNIHIVSGRNSLNKLVNLPKEVKIILFSISTLQSMIVDYEKSKTLEEYYSHGFNFTPDDVQSLTNIGLLVNDELHQHFNAICKILLYTNVPKVIGASATFNHNYREIKFMYKTLIPEEYIIRNLVEYKPYIDLIIWKYNINYYRNFRYTLKTNYSHVMFEESLSRNSMLLNGYLDMVIFIIKDIIKKRSKENVSPKILIFSSTVKLCEKLLYKSNKLLDRKYIINKYTQEDSFIKIQNFDICFSTILSSGTAIDIKGLTDVINTVSVKSLQYNLQSLGRLRNIENIQVRYHSVYTEDITLQKHYHQERMSIFKRRIKNTELREYRKKIDYK